MPIISLQYQVYESKEFVRAFVATRLLKENSGAVEGIPTQFLEHRVCTRDSTMWCSHIDIPSTGAGTNPWVPEFPVWMQRKGLKLATQCMPWLPFVEFLPTFSSFVTGDQTRSNSRREQWCCQQLHLTRRGLGELAAGFSASSEDAWRQASCSTQEYLHGFPIISSFTRKNAPNDKRYPATIHAPQPMRRSLQVSAGRREHMSSSASCCCLSSVDCLVGRRLAKSMLSNILKKRMCSL